MQLINDEARPLIAACGQPFACRDVDASHHRRSPTRFENATPRSLRQQQSAERADSAASGKKRS